MSLDQIGQYERNKIKERNPRGLNDQSAFQSAGVGMKACFGGQESSDTWQTSNGAIGKGKEGQLKPQKTYLQQQRDYRGPQQDEQFTQEQQQAQAARGNRGQANRQAYNILTGQDC